MSLRTKGEAAEAGRAAVAKYRDQARRLENLAQRAGQSAESARQGRAGHLQALVNAMLTSAHPDRVAAIEKSVALGDALSRRRDELVEEHEARKRRRGEIQQERLFNEREQFSVEQERAITATHENIARLREVMKPFDECEPLQWLLVRGVHLEAPSDGGFSKFWRVVSLADRREESARKKVIETFQAEDFQQVVVSYGVHQSRMKEFESLVEKLQGQAQTMEAFIKEHGTLQATIEDVANIQRDALRETLAEELSSVDVHALHARVPLGFKVLVATLSAQDWKAHYLRRLASYLQREADDRNNRAASIDKVCVTWARRPYNPVYGDKSKWLITIPEMKETSTVKRLGWCEIILDNIANYDRYETYSAVMSACEESGQPIVPFDIFAFRAEPRMPYEGFTRELFDDLDAARKASGAKKADATLLRGAEKSGRQSRRAHNKARKRYRKKRKKSKKIDLDFELEYGWDDELDEDLDAEFDIDDGIDGGDLALAVVAGAIAADALMDAEGGLGEALEEAGAFVDAS